MDKSEFESAGGGIKKGDLVLVVKPDDLFPSLRLSALAGVYDPIDNDDHPYFKIYSELHKNLRDIVNNTFLLWRTPTIDLDNPKVDVHNYGSGNYDVRYTECRAVRLLMKARDLEEFLRFYK